MVLIFTETYLNPQAYSINNKVTRQVKTSLTGVGNRKLLRFQQPNQVYKWGNQVAPVMPSLGQGMCKKLEKQKWPEHMEAHSHMRFSGLQTNKIMSFPYQESVLITTKNELVPQFTTCLPNNYPPQQSCWGRYYLHYLYQINNLRFRASLVT